MTLKINKMLRKIFLATLLVLAVFSCKKAAVVDEPGEYVVTGEYSDLTPYSVSLSGYAYPTRIMRNLQIGIIISENAEPTEDNGNVYSTYNDAQDRFIVPISHLKEETTYYYRAFLFHKETNGQKKYYGEIKSFMTPANTITVTTKDPIVGVTQVDIYGSLFIEYERPNISTLPRFVFGKTREEVESGSGDVLDCLWCSDHDFNTRKYFEGGDRYYFRAIVNVEGVDYYGEIKSFTPASFVPSAGPAVDMGLSVKWGSCNVGANYPEEAGDYFAWGETSPKESYSSDNYSCPSLTSGDLPLSDDAASVNLGSGWRMPTYDEIQELSENSLHEWGEYRSVRGYMFISIRNGNAVFFPAAGYMDGSLKVSSNSQGRYWNSKTVLPVEENGVGYLQFSYPGSCSYFAYFADPFLGYSVRGVYEL